METVTIRLPKQYPLVTINDRLFQNRLLPLLSNVCIKFLLTDRSGCSTACCIGINRSFLDEERFNGFQKGAKMFKESPLWATKSLLLGIAGKHLQKILMKAFR